MLTVPYSTADMSAETLVLAGIQGGTNRVHRKEENERVVTKRKA